MVKLLNGEFVLERNLTFVDTHHRALVIRSQTHVEQDISNLYI